MNSAEGAAEETQLLRAALQELRDVKAALDEHSIVAITDARGRITYANDKFCSISKYSRPELLGQDHRIINSGHHPKEFFQNLWAAIARGEVWRGEIRNRAKDGGHYWVDTTIYPFLSSDGRAHQYIAIRTDITQRKAAEQDLENLARALAEKNKELESIVYAASHDLRSPLVNVHGFSNRIAGAAQQMQSILDTATDGHIPVEKVREAFLAVVPQAVDFIQAGVMRMDSLLTGLLKYSRLGHVALHPQDLDMNAVLGEVVHALRFQAEGAGAVVHLERLPGCVGDLTQLGQVFSNLLDNALKYREPSRPLRVRIRGWTDRDRAIYSVEDNGLGIASEHQAAAFEVFRRLDPQAAAGEGLGLAIARRSLDRLYGRIWVESRRGSGSTFFVALPAISARA